MENSILLGMNIITACKNILRKDPYNVPENILSKLKKNQVIDIGDPDLISLYVMINSIYRKKWDELAE